MAKFQVVETDQYQPIGEEFEADDMCEALNMILNEHGVTVRAVDDEEDENSHIEILQHDVSYYLDDDSEIELGDSESEHIEYMIGQGCSSGELNKTDPKDDDSIRGWWSITKEIA